MRMTLCKPEELNLTLARAARPSLVNVIRGIEQTTSVCVCEYSSLFPPGGIQSLCSGQTKARLAPGILQPSFEGRSFFCTQHQQTPGPSRPLRHPPAQSNLLWQRAAPRLSSPLLLFDSLGRPHTYRPSGFSLYTRTNVCIYIWLFLSYFITFHHYWTLGEHVHF